MPTLFSGFLFMSLRCEQGGGGTPQSLVLGDAVIPPGLFILQSYV